MKQGVSNFRQKLIFVYESFKILKVSWGQNLNFAEISHNIKNIHFVKTSKNEPLKEFIITINFNFSKCEKNIPIK